MKAKQAYDQVLQDFESKEAANTPEQISTMLKKKMKGAQDLLKALERVDYSDYNIGDFFKDDLPKLRVLSDRIMKRKKDLESSLFGFVRQAKSDLSRTK
jgi:hypothetical protein